MVEKEIKELDLMNKVKQHRNQILFDRSVKEKALTTCLSATNN